MSKRRMLIAFLAVTLATPLVDAASAAKKKVTYDEAWKLCKAELDKSGAPGTGTQANERHTRGAGCMRKYGYRTLAAGPIDWSCLKWNQRGNYMAKKRKAKKAKIKRKRTAKKK